MPSFIETLPDEIKTQIPAELVSNPNLTKYATVGDFVKGHINAVDLLGKKGVIIPDANSSDEIKVNFRKALGIPEKAEDYKFSPIEGFKADENIQAQIKGMFLKHNVSAAAADGLQQDYVKMVMGMEQARIKAQNDALLVSQTALKQKWGNKYDDNLALATRMVKQVGGDEIITKLGNLESTPEGLEFLVKVAGMLSEDAIGRIGFSATTTDKTAAAKTIEDMRNRTGEFADPKHPLFDENHPGHKRAVEERKKLYELVYPEGA
jgi:hypothetical protein